MEMVESSLPMSGVHLISALLAVGARVGPGDRIGPLYILYMALCRTHMS